MRLAIMQPYIFPYIGYYQLINAVDKFVIYDDVAFINRGWINRNQILVNDKAFLFSIPLNGASQNRLIRDITLADFENWKLKFLRTVAHSYKKARYFENTYELLGEVFNSDFRNISQLAIRSLRLVSSYLGLNVQFVESSAIYNNTDLKGQDRIVNICIQEKSSYYINPIGGREIYNMEFFARSGIKLNFIKTKTFPYKQFHNNFVANLSIIDVLMFNSIGEVREMLDFYELI
jgi:WbqC-like protein family